MTASGAPSSQRSSGPSGAESAASKPSRTGGGAAMVAAGILLSRLAGLVRQRVIAHYFGLSVLADVIAAAFRIGNVTQYLLGEGALSASFIPVYAKLRAEGRARDAATFALAALGALLVAVTAVSALGVSAAPWLSRAIVPGFSAEALASTTRLTRVLFPMTGLVILSAWGLGVLNAHRRFFVPYAAPVLWSAAQIAGLVVLGSALGVRGEPLAMGLAVASLAGALLQVLVMLPSTRRILGALRPRFDRADPNLREAVRRLPGAVVGRGVIQVAGLVDAALVSLTGPGAQAAFQYTQTIYLLPLSLLGAGEAAALLPAMAGDTAEDDRARRIERLRGRLGGALVRVAVLAIPATAALAFLGAEILRVLLQGGSFDAAAAARVQRLLAAYAFALLGNAWGRVLTAASHALGDTRTPARYGVIRVLAGGAAAVLLMMRYDALGVVLGSVVAAWVETFALARKLRTELGGLGVNARFVLVSLGNAAIATVSAATVRHLLPAPFAASVVGALVVLTVFGAVYLGLATMTRVLDVRTVLRRGR
ncbi:MAG: murein biosynthesis integral membrane protein MurJ [Polyangiaceae bacterium]